MKIIKYEDDIHITHFNQSAVFLTFKTQLIINIIIFNKYLKLIKNMEPNIKDMLSIEHSHS